MAREVVLRDDMDGSYDDVETVELAWAGRAVELDLSAANRTKLDELLAPYLEAGRRRRPSAGPRRRRTSASPSAAEKKRRTEIRAWAAAAGVEVSPLGPIPAHVIEQYEAAQTPPAAPPEA